MAKFLGPFFSKPILNKEVFPDFSMFAELQKIFANISVGATIRVAIYMWNQDSGLNRKGFREKWHEEPGNPKIITDILTQKAITGDMKIILDNYISEYHKKTLRHLMVCLGEDNIIIDTRTGVNDPEYRRELFKKGKFADGGYMHDKFFLISEVDGLGKYVIIQMTANINITQCHQFNNAIVIYDDEELYNKYMRHWDNLRQNIECRKNNQKIVEPNYFAGESVDNLDPEVSVFFFPRANCPIEAELVRLLEKDGRARVDVAMAYLTRNRFINLLGLLRQNYKRVRVILSEEEQNSKTVDKLDSLGIKYRVIKNHKYNNEIYVDENGDKRIRDNWQARMHHKFVLIQDEDKKITWTGSYNLTYPGLRHNDEAVVRIVDDGVYRRYRKTFNMLFTPIEKMKRILI